MDVVLILVPLQVQEDIFCLRKELVALLDVNAGHRLAQIEILVIDPLCCHFVVSELALSR